MTEPLPDHAVRKLLAVAAAEREDQDGERRVGRYRLVRELGRGGMGVVHEAIDTELGRRVALKILAVPPGAPADLRERFEREALAAARLSHPNIAAVYEAHGEMIAMQLVDGAPLSSLPRGDRRRLVLQIRDAALAVHYAHEHGIVHRDIKPHNLLIERDRVVVTDFGLAKHLTADAAPSLSVSGHILGTPSYMAPEQASGRVHDVDPRTDVYGLGATLFDLIGGRPPFVEEDVVRLLRRIVEDEPPRLRTFAPTVPHDLENVVRKALAKEPERRYPSAAALAEDLTRWLEGEPVLAQPPSVRYRLAKFVQRRRAAVIVGAIGLVALLVAVAIWLNERDRRRSAKDALRLSIDIAKVLDDARNYTRLGQLPFAHRRLDAGIAACRALPGSSDVAEAQYLVGRLLRARGQAAAALVALDRALALDPELAVARAERGLLLVRELTLRLDGTPLHPVEALGAADRRQHRRARDDLSRAVERPGAIAGADLAQGRGELARLNGEIAQARRHLEECLRLDPLREDAKFSLSRVALAEGDDATARALALASLDIPRGFGIPYADQGAVETMPVTAEGAIRLPGIMGDLFDFAAVLRVAPSQAAAFGQRSVNNARLAAERLGVDDLDGALAALEDAIRDTDAAIALETSMPSGLNNRAVYRFAQASVLERGGRSQEVGAVLRRARSDLEAARAAGPANPIIARNRALLLRD
ncbi:MAG: protein kinase [Planctomycetota bacterium]